jgi:hypothetical protein
MVVVDELYKKDTKPETESRGLEIPFNMMTRLGGATQIVDFDGGVVVKGFSSAFVPVVVTTDFIQWHYTYNEDDSRLSYNDVVARYPQRLMLEDCSLSAAKSKKCFLGWVGNAVHKFGTDRARYDRISYSDTKEPPRPLNFRGGSIGFQNIGTGELNFSPGLRDGRLHVHRDGPYKRILKHASTTPVTLYDTHEQRAWLVPASAVITHIVQKRLQLDRGSDGVLNAEIVATVPTADIACDAEDMLLANANVLLNEEEQDYGMYQFRDMVSSIWSLLEIILDKNVQRHTTSSPSVRMTLHKYLNGWEFMDIVKERSPFRLKEAKLPKSHGGWIELVEDIDSIVLFATKLGNLIEPAKEAQGSLCDRWKRVPKYNHYLTTSVSMLEGCYEEAGSKESREYLTTSDLRWHSGGELFDSCRFSIRSRCLCDRTQQIFHKSALSLTRIIPPGPLEEAGAVIFGRRCDEQPSRSRHDDPTTERNTIYRQPNVTLTNSTALCSELSRMESKLAEVHQPRSESLTACSPSKSNVEISQRTDVDSCSSLHNAPHPRTVTTARRP